MATSRKARHCGTCQCAPAVASTAVVTVIPASVRPADPAIEVDPVHTCAVLGHDYSDRLDRVEDGTYGWRACSCAGALPGHAAGCDPTGGPGCGMAYRLCRFCDHTAEAALIDGLPAGYGDVPDLDYEPRRLAGARVQVQPGGSLRQDVAAGLALPTDTTHTSGHATTGETAMVERHRATAHPADRLIGGAA